VEAVMKLLQRYRNLNLWNKVAFYGSLCSILGLLFYLLFPSSHSKAKIQVSHSPGAIVQSAIDSPNAVQSVTINENKQQFRPASPEIQRSVEEKLATFRVQYAATPPVVTIEYEQGNDERFKVGAALGEMLSKQGIGGFDGMSTYIGRFPGYGMTLRCGTNGLVMASAFLSAISNYLTGQVSIVTIRGWPANKVCLYLNGTPSFSENGSVIME
jgi:hypothetical protein